MHILGFAKHLKFFPLCVLFQQWAAEKLQKSTSVCRSFCQGDKIVKIFWCQKYQLEDAEVKKKTEDAFVLLGRDFIPLEWEKFPAFRGGGGGTWSFSLLSVGGMFASQTLINPGVY